MVVIQKSTSSGPLLQFGRITCTRRISAAETSETLLIEDVAAEILRVRGPTTRSFFFEIFAPRPLFFSLADSRLL